jgi:predicted phage tail protein
MKTIYLHGSLKERHPEPIRVHASTAVEALSVLKQLPTFDATDPVSVRVKGFECRDALYEITDMEEIHVYPALVGGGGKGGVLQIIVGVVVVIVGIVLSVFGYGSGTPLIMSGMMMILGGILMMLAPTPKSSGDGSKQSLYIPSNQNTTKIGTRIPLIYGRVRRFGHYLSFNVDARSLDDSKMNLAGYCSGKTDDNGTRYTYGTTCLIA